MEYTLMLVLVRGWIYRGNIQVARAKRIQGCSEVFRREDGSIGEIGDGSSERCVFNINP